MPVILVVNNDVPAKTAREFAALPRVEQPARSSSVTPASERRRIWPANCSRSVTGVDVQQVPYRGIPALLPDLLAGRIAAAFPNISVVLQLVQDGKLRALAVTSRRRATATPDVPTMSEAGLPAIDADAWFGLMAPAGTPAPIVRAAPSQNPSASLAQGDVRRSACADLGMRWWRIHRQNSPRS